MKRICIGLCLLVLVGCKDDPPPAADVCGGAASCSSSADCALGDVCESNCCVPFEGCSPDSCAAGMFCDEDFVCKSIAEKCNVESCECHILNSAGQLEADGDPRIVLTSGASRKLQAVLTLADGGQLPGATFEWSLDSTSSFTLDGDTVTATATPTATPEPQVTATASGSSISCTATLVNLGPAPAAGVRFYVFDDITGEAVAGAKVVVGTADSAVTTSGTTDVDGLVTLGSLSGTINVSVFKDGFNYLSVVGLDASSTHDVALPLSPRPAEPMVGGFTGKLDWSHYDKLKGGSRELLGAIVGSSIPLKSVLNFDLATFVGPLPEVDCSANPSSAGCYPIEIPGLTESGTVAPLPGGVVLGYGKSDIKGHFDTVGVPGRRYAWSLGGKLRVGDLGPLISLLLPYFTSSTSTCDCDATADVCDASCTCDTDCPPPFGQIFNNLVPLLPELATGAKANIPLVETSLATWNEYIAAEYGTGRSTDFDKYPFPVLDSGTGKFYYGKLLKRQFLSVFTDYSAPALPNDPKTGHAMEGMLVLTGVNAAGFGFVPLGLGAGLDCTEGNCLDRVGNAANFDGRVNGGQVCFYDIDADKNRCDDLPGLPNDAASQGMLPAGHLGVFHAKAHSGLEGQEWLTIVVAAPLSTLGATSGFRATAYVLREEPPQGAGTLPDSFHTFPTPVVSDRTYTVSGDSTSSVHWVTVATSSSSTGRTVRWNIYFPNGGGTFIAPDPVADGGVPAGGSEDRVDPFAPESAPDRDVPMDHINVTHLAFKLADGLTLTELVANNGTTLNDMLEHIEAFSAQNDNVDPTP